MEHKCYGPYEKFIKRPLDCILSLCALIVLSPVLGIIALLVRKNLGSPIIFTQNRPGRIDKKTGKEKVFKLYKFRTMTDERDENGNLLPDSKRLTKFGNAIRRASIDELPELINIIKGDMAVVGPRPLLVNYLTWYTDEQHKRHYVRPGLTGYAQANGRNAVDWDDKFDMDCEYASHITFLGDCKIIFDTVIAVFKREGISSETSATMEDFRVYCRSIGREPKNINEKISCGSEETTIYHEQTFNKRNRSDLHDR